jgi:hypothetical protein
MIEAHTMDDSEQSEEISSVKSDMTTSDNECKMRQDDDEEKEIEVARFLAAMSAKTRLPEKQDNGVQENAQQQAQLSTEDCRNITTALCMCIECV